MKVFLAENAGFCFGVKLAVDEAIKTQNKYNKQTKNGEFTNANRFHFSLL